MASVFDKYGKLIEKRVLKAEKKMGNLPDGVIKQYFVNKHNMNLEDVFLQPDLEGLEKYEKWLDEGNKKR